MLQKRKNIKTLGNLINTRGATRPRTNQIASCFDALSITNFTIHSLAYRATEGGGAPEGVVVEVVREEGGAAEGVVVVVVWTE
jgi:hypothetical protein